MSPLIGSARYRTHTCAGAVDAEGGRARVAGWVHRRRDHGGVVFIDLRDRSGILQLVFHPEGAGAAAHAAAGELSPEDVVSVEGEVVARSPETVNEGIPTGRVELRAEALDMLSEAEPLPFSVEDETQEPSEELRLTYRYLDIRPAPAPAGARDAGGGGPGDAAGAGRRGLPRGRDPRAHALDARGRA